jgi:hypothetical protein
MTQHISNNQNQPDDQLDLIARTVVQNQQDIADMKNDLKENVARKSDIDSLNSTLDEILGIVKKKDQELSFMGERVKRIEDDLRNLKPVVGICIGLILSYIQDKIEAKKKLK